jgi:diguanylate cyclase (GGDEF)-like protein
MNRPPTSRISLSALLAAALFVALASCSADTAPPMAHGAQGPVEPRLEVLTETDGPLAIHAVTSPPYATRFAPVKESPLYVRGGAGGMWLRFRLDEPGSATRESRLLELAPSFAIILDRADLYLPVPGADGRRAYAKMEAGAMRPMRAGEIPSRSFLFEVPAGTLRAEYAYLRLESAMDVAFSVRQWNPVELGMRSVRYFLAFGLIYGILIAMIVYNFFIFVSLRDRSYLFYILYMVSALLWQLHVQGHGRMLMGTHPGVDLRALWVMVGGVQLWGGVFSIEFLALRRHLPRVHVAIVALTAVGALIVGAGILGLHRAAFDLSHFGGLALPVAIIIAAVLRLRQGYAPARFYVFAWSMLSIGGIVFALMGLKLLPVSFWTVNGVSLGMAAESLLLSLALADRIRTLKEEKEFFEKSQKRYMELSVTDSLTGLYNRRYLQSKLESEIQHSLRLEQPLSLVMLDLDDFKAVNDLHGHAFGDVVLERLAAVMRVSSREVDVSCRYGGEEFALIMPGTHGEDAVHTAERIRARFAAEVFTAEGGTGINLTVSLGVAELQKDDTADALLERADRAMYRAKRLGKNRTER